MRVRLYENHRFVLYAPFYAAHAIGAYAAEGLTVELLPSPGVGLAEQALLDGRGRGHLGRPDAGHEAPRRQPRLGARLLRRDRLPRPVLDHWSISLFGFPAGRPRANARCHGQRGAVAVALPAGGSAAGWDRPRATRSR